MSKSNTPAVPTLTPTFVTMWKDLLDNNEKYSSKFNTLYFNAWENDYITDPLLALVSEIEAEIKREDSKFKKNFNKVKEEFYQWPN